MTSLKRLRTQIDQLDESLLRLLNQRGKLVQSVGRIKERRKQSVFVPSRERILRILATMGWKLRASIRSCGSGRHGWASPNRT